MRCGLVISNLQRGVFVSSIEDALREEHMPWNLVEDLEDFQIVDPLGSDIFDKAAPVSDVSPIP